ncbi:hypothetical protein B4U80_04236 [Leptotrombidium deliense]|uniref:FHF complex subunit HOOK-interacting protein C-terminal domain-containing protein n=1 Tax=Leptotrombidium deliense TaxID=299467 RepID=A0A443SSJ9_9ACAR|nr:hypothetical protein B4U80_04236 [Leptotrombidium deliense]
MSEWLKRLKNSSSSSAKSTTDSDSTSKSDDMLLNAHLDRKAVLDSFKNHWLQAWNIMLTKRIPMRFDTTNGGDANVITNDDVTTIINHIEQMTTLLLEENKHVSTCIASPIAMSPLMGKLLYFVLSFSFTLFVADYLLMESVLDKIFNWSLNAGEYTNVMKMEQLKLYELLITELCHQTALFQKPLIRPLLQLLATCGDCAPVEVEKRLVILLNTLCVSIEKNTHLLELFFAPYNDKEDVNVPSVSEITSSPQIISKFSYLHKPESRFLIVSLLIPFVHREGPIGQQARDSLLVILSLSRTQEAIGAYIAEHSNFCPVLATGLSGLYSSLPRKLPYDAIQMGDWHQITTEDINESPELRNFLHSLEFCNAVVQVSHAVVTNQLLEYIYQGFLVSVVGPALHQNSLEEMIATTAYLELFLRTINEPSLLQVFLRFVCVEKFDEQRILHTLIGRINANTKLGLVTIVFFRTLLDLNCEDVLLELVLKYLITCDFVGDERCESLSDVKDFDKCAQKFLSLIPSCCFATMQTYSPIKCSNNEDQHIEDDAYGLSPISPTLSHTLHPLNNYIEYLNDGHYAIKCCQTACKMWSTSYTVAKDENAQSPVSRANNEVNATQVPETQSTISQSTNWGESCLIGPFLSNVFDRLSNMQSNDVYTNLQLTGLLSRLATYSQPILRSFLLNPHLTASCKCRNLWSVLSTVQQQLEKSAAEIDNFVDLWIKTKDFFKSREELLMKSDSRKHSNTSSEVFITIETPKEPKRRSISQLLFRSRAQSTPVNPHTLKSIGNGAGYKYINKRHSRVDEAIEAEQLAKSLQQQRTALSIVVLEEFLKELSALAQEHFILGYTSECRVN